MNSEEILQRALNESKDREKETQAELDERINQLGNLQNKYDVLTKKHKDMAESYQQEIKDFSELACKCHNGDKEYAELKNQYAELQKDYTDQFNKVTLYESGFTVCRDGLGCLIDLMKANRGSIYSIGVDLGCFKGLIEKMLSSAEGDKRVELVANDWKYLLPNLSLEQVKAEPNYQVVRTVDREQHVVKRNRTENVEPSEIQYFMLREYEEEDDE